MSYSMFLRPLLENTKRFEDLRKRRNEYAHIVGTEMEEKAVADLFGITDGSGGKDTDDFITDLLSGSPLVTFGRHTGEVSLEDSES